MFALLLLACSTPDPFTPGTDDDDTDNAADTDPPVSSGVDCSSSLGVTFPGGERSPIPCEDASLSATMEFDPDDPPEVRTLTVHIDGSSSSGFQCELSLSIEGVCGPESYWVGSRVSVSVETWDCAGAPDDFEGSFSAFDGAITLTTLETTDEVGDLTGQAVPVRVAGDLDLQLPDGMRLDGHFQVRRTVTGEDAEEQECAVSGPVVAEPITGGELYGVWGNGSNDRYYQYELQLAGGITPDDCPRCDRAGNLRLRLLSGDPPRDLDGDTLTLGVRSETGEAFERDPSTGVWTRWGDGEVGGRGWTGFREQVEGAFRSEESLVLSW